MKNLNECNGFNWVTDPRDDYGYYAKCSAGGESFWIKDCKPTDTGTFIGVINNDLMCTDIHGLVLWDTVEFLPNWEPSQ